MQQICQEVLHKIELADLQKLKRLYADNQRQLAKFLPVFMQNNIRYNQIVENQTFRGHFETILKATRQSDEKFRSVFKERKETIINQLKILCDFQKNRSTLFKVDRKNIRDIQQINGGELEVKIIYFTKMLDENHFYQYFSLKQQAKRFVKTRAGRHTFPIISQRSELRILQCIEQVTDQYTGLYQFDPFFKSMKFLISFKNKSKKFTKSFKIKDSNQITLIQQFIAQDWGDQQQLKLSDPSQKLVDYICKKQQASQDTKKYLMEIINNHHMIHIKDLVCNPKEFIKYINQQKWANQIEAAILKVKTKTNEQFNGNQRDKDKLYCYKVGNSHKILRFLFLINRNDLGRGLQQLKISIPPIFDKVLIKAIQIIETQLPMERVFQQITAALKHFTIVPRINELKKVTRPFGLLFYGPPGTGKTRLTQDLMQLAGFHPISRGLSSSEFMKELVGQSKGMVQSLLFRPNLSKHLACFLSIDEIDAIVGNRNDEKNKNSGEATSMFLSALGGNQAVDNIIVLGSTNYKAKIDDAIARRLMPNIYVGLPNEAARQKILKYYMISPENHRSNIQFLKEITINFSGAALQVLCREINLRIKLKNSINPKILLHLTKSTAQYFKIKFGDVTYPDLRDRFKVKLNQTFFTKLFKNVLIANKIDQATYKFTFMVQELKWVKGKASQYLDIKDRMISISQQGGQGLEALKSFISSQIKVIKIFQANIKEYQNPTVLLVHSRSQQETIHIISNAFQKQEYQKKKLYVIIYYQNGKESIDSRVAFEMFQSQTTQKNFTGRMLVDLSNQLNCMQFQLIQNEKSDSTHKIPLMSFGESKAVLPEVIDYFMMMHNVGIIQVVNNKFLIDNSAFTDEAIISTINTKFDEVQFYSKAAVIIQLDDLISINRSISTSQTGPSESISINQPNIFKSLVVLINKGAQINMHKSLWIVIIVRNQQLAKMLRKQIDFPLTFEQKKNNYQEMKKQKREQDKKNTVKTCANCNQFYTEEQNEKQKKCAQHFGLFYTDRDLSLIKDESDYYITDQKKASYFLEICNQACNKDNKMTLRMTCCWKQADSQGCRAFKHYEGGTQKIEQGQNVQMSQIDILRQKNMQKWINQCDKMRKIRCLSLNEDMSIVKPQNLYNRLMKEQKHQDKNPSLFSSKDLQKYYKPDNFNRKRY